MVHRGTSLFIRHSRALFNPWAAFSRRPIFYVDESPAGYVTRRPNVSRAMPTGWELARTGTRRWPPPLMEGVWWSLRPSPKRTLWRLRIADSVTTPPAADRISLTTGTGFGPIIFCLFLPPVRARAYGSSPMELERSCGVIKEPESLAGRQSHPMDGRSHSLSGNTGRRFYT